MTRPNPAKAVAATESVVDLRLWGVMGLGALLLMGAPLWAEGDENITTSHGYSNFGELHYAADFPHLDYVNPDAPKGGEMSQWALGNFDTFNPYTRRGVAAAGVTLQMESIMVPTADDPYGSYCYLCTTLEYPESRDWVIFNLRDDVTFSDGRPMTADDVVFSMDLVLEQGITEYREFVSTYIEEVEALSPTQVKFTFTETAPRQNVIDIAGGTTVFSRDWFEETERRLDEPSLEPFLGTGPYLLDSYEIGRRVVYGRNPNFWGADHPMNVGQNNFDFLRYEYFADGVTALEGFKAGTYTFRNENSSKNWAEGYNAFPALQDGYVVKTELPNGAIASAQAWVFNLDRPEWQDPRVREAIGLAFNFEWSNESLFFGLYSRVNSFWGNTHLEVTGIPSEGELEILTPLVEEGLLDASILTDDAVTSPTAGTRLADRGNLRRAGQLLDEAGWLVGDDGMRYKDGELLRVEFLGRSPAFDRIVNPYVENLQRLGIEARLDRVDPSSYTERRRTGDFDLTNHNLTQGYEPGSSLIQYFSSTVADDSSRNVMRLRSPAVDRLIEPVINATTLDELETSIHALDRVLRAERFWVPQWFKDTHTIAYFDMYEHPEDLPPFALGQASFWWYNAERGEELRAAGVLN